MNFVAEDNRRTPRKTCPDSNSFTMNLTWSEKENAEHAVVMECSNHYATERANVTICTMMYKCYNMIS